MDFWHTLDELVAGCELVIDRPRGSAHPRYPEFIYPLDYGYLAATLTADGGGIDVWRGSQPDRRVTAIVCTVDLVRRDAEIKILLACSPDEARQAVDAHNRGSQAAVLLMRGA